MRERIAHYRIVEELGRGGMGVVYKALEESLNRYVAIKVLGAHLAADQDYVKRFVREAQAAAALNHPNIIQIYGIGEEGGEHYFAMEYVDGVSLQELIRREGRIPNPRAAAIVLEAAKGLAAAHDRGIIHRDIKPANIMIDRQGMVKIADFGLALRPADQTRITASGLLMGTPGYLAPEQCLDGEVDRRTDIYALGVTFFEALAGRPPFQADSPASLIRKIVDGEAPDIAELAPDVDEETREILARMMARDPGERYQTCYQLAADLKSYLARHGGEEIGAVAPAPHAHGAPADEAAPTTPVPSGPGGPEAEARRGVPAALLAVLLLVVLGTAGAGVVAWRAGWLAGVGRTLASVLPGGSGPDSSGTSPGGAAADTPPPAVAATETELAPGSDVAFQGAAAPQGEATGGTISPPAGAAPSSEEGPAVAGGGTVELVGGRRTAEPEPGAPPLHPRPGPEEPLPPVGGPATAPAPPPPRGVAVVDLGEPLFGGAAEAFVERELASRGVEVVDEAGWSDVGARLAAGRLAAPEALELTRGRVAAAVLIQVEPVGERQLRYMGRSDTAWTADVTVTAFDPETGASLAPPCRVRLEYTTLSAQRVAEQKLADCAWSLADALLRR